jgi:hypothetical protein
LNKFERARKAREGADAPDAGADQLNRFQRHTLQVEKERAAGTAFQERVERRQEGRANWVGDRRVQRSSATGMILDPATAEAQAADRKSRQPATAAQPLDYDSVRAIIDTFLADHTADFHQTPLNLKNFQHVFLHFLEMGHLPTYPTCTLALAYQQRYGYYEEPGPREPWFGTPQQAKVYPSAEERAAQVQAREEAAAKKRQEEAAAARNMPMSELRAKARGQMRQYGHVERL